MLLPDIEWQQKHGKQVVLRAGAGFAKPEISEELEERGVKYAIRLLANDCLERDIAELLTRPVGRPSPEPLFRYESFLLRGGELDQGRQSGRQDDPLVLPPLPLE